MLPKSITKFVKLLLILAPPLLIGILIFRNGVDVPVLDEWDGTAPLFEKMADGSLGFGDFYAQHNEHRIFFPRLIFFALGRLTHWDIRAELWVIFLLTLVCLFNIWQIARRGAASQKRRLGTLNPDLLPMGEPTAFPEKLREQQLVSQSLPLGETPTIVPVRLGPSWDWQKTEGDFQTSSNTFWLLFAASLLLFNPQNVANFLWGFQVGFLLPLACVTACIWTAAYLRYPFNFLAAIILCTICTFSIGGGFTSWLLTTPLLLLAQTHSTSSISRKWWATWIFLFCAELLLFFWGYHKPPNHPPVWWFLRHPIVAAEYILLFFGGPFSHGTNLSSIAVGLSIGGLLLVMLLIAAFYIWTQRPDRNLLAEVLPWFVLAMVSLNYAILIMVGRAGLGPNQARAPRYLPFAVMLPIALLALAPLIYRHWAPSTSTGRRWLAKGAFAAAILVLTVFTCAGSLASLPFWPILRQLGAYRKSLITFVNVLPVTDELRDAVFPWPERVQASVNSLNRIRYWRPPLSQSNRISDSANGVDEDAAGAFQFNNREAGWINANGWAFLANERRPADAILITFDNADARGNPRVCAIARVGSSDELDNFRGAWDASALPSRWRARFSRDRLPKGQHCYLEAWAFNVAENRAYRLPGDAFFLW